MLLSIIALDCGLGFGPQYFSGFGRNVGVLALYTSSAISLGEKFTAFIPKISSADIILWPRGERSSFHLGFSFSS